MNKIKNNIFSHYKYSYPINNFLAKRSVLNGSFFINKKNPFLNKNTGLKRGDIKERIDIVLPHLRWIKKYIKKLLPRRKIICIFIYGSFVFSPKDYKPNDIDIGVIVEGSFFGYKKIKNIPKKLKAIVGGIDLFIYGIDNMEKGVMINDTIKGGLLHKNVIKNEIAIASIRNVVVYGKIFENNRYFLYNIYIFLINNIFNVEKRLLRYGCNNKKESDCQCLCKIANRLYELNVFFTIFGKSPIYSFKKINSWPKLALEGKLNISELKMIYKKTRKEYFKIKDTMTKKNNYKPNIKRCVSQPFIVAGCLIKEKNKFLFVEENGKYNIPQGWVEIGESLEKAAKREAEEETGLEIKISSIHGIYTLVKQKNNVVLHKVKVIYDAKLTGRKKTTKEKLPIRWMSINDMKNNINRMWDKDVLNIIKNKEGYKKINEQ